jgi:hypothetical protein
MLQGTAWGNQWDYWQYFQGNPDDHVVQFDGPTRTIWILEGIEEVLVKEHLYSDWKEWIALYDHSKYLQAFETEGGRPVSDTERLGDSYLLINDWVIRQKDSSTPVDIVGNLYAYDLNGDPKDPYGNDPNGGRSINSVVSNIVNTIIITETEQVPSLSPEQEWIMKMAYEEARRSRAMQTNRVAITSVGEGDAQVDTITVYDDDGTTVLYEIRVTGEDCDNRSVQYEKPYCPETTPPTPCE